MNVRQILILENPVQTYAWGSRTAIPRLLGLTAPAGEPVAELWMGAHPRAPSRVRLGGGLIPLHELVEQAPQEVLGARVSARFSGKFPFLFKVLAAEKPLSIQVHPDRRSAQEGYERENRAGVPLEAPHRNYRDPNHKPELVCSLKPFEALKGFRRPSEILENLSQACPDSLAQDLDAFRRAPDAKGLSRLFQRLLGLQGEERRRVVEEALGNAGRLAEKDPVFRWVEILHEEFPEDQGILAPLLLNLVRLEPGQGLFLPAGELHSYLRGTAVEIMANSDNVLRGGLTEKHVDPEELLRLVRFEPGKALPLTPRASGPREAVFDTPAEEFGLSIIEGETRIERGEEPAWRGPEILLCISGRGLAVEPETGRRVEATRGTSLLIPAAVASYEIRGDLRLFRAHVP